MRITRIYHGGTLGIGQALCLDRAASHHLQQVLRVKLAQTIELFNGDGFNYTATISALAKKTVTVNIHDKKPNNSESPLNIHLAQVISRGDKMDFTLQKAVELGVSAITPLTSERCDVRLSAERQQKKLQHWQRVIIAACEQSGRSVVPVLHPITTLNTFAEQCSEQTINIMLQPNAEYGFNHIVTSNQVVKLLIGAEGGFSAQEIERLTTHHHFQTCRMGPRILRTETAGLVAISLLQALQGDLNHEAPLTSSPITLVNPHAKN